MAAYEDLADAFEAYDAALYDAYGEMTPLDIYSGDDDGDDDEDGAPAAEEQAVSASSTATTASSRFTWELRWVRGRRCRSPAR